MPNIGIMLGYGKDGDNEQDNKTAIIVACSCREIGETKQQEMADLFGKFIDPAVHLIR
jgi:hypothetical protein